MLTKPLQLGLLLSLAAASFASRQQSSSTSQPADDSQEKRQAASLGQLGTAIVLYSSNHDWHLPPALSDIHPGPDFPLAAAEIREPDLTYLGAPEFDMINLKPLKEFVIALRKVQNPDGPNRYVLLFADVHVTSLGAAEATQALARSAELRKSSLLPPQHPVPHLWPAPPATQP